MGASTPPVDGSNKKDRKRKLIFTSVLTESTMDDSVVSNAAKTKTKKKNEKGSAARGVPRESTSTGPASDDDTKAVEKKTAVPALNPVSLFFSVDDPKKKKKKKKATNTLDAEGKNEETATTKTTNQEEATITTNASTEQQPNCSTPKSTNESAQKKKKKKKKIKTTTTTTPSEADVEEKENSAPKRRKTDKSTVSKVSGSVSTEMRQKEEGNDDDEEEDEGEDEEKQERAYEEKMMTSLAAEVVYESFPLSGTTTSNCVHECVKPAHYVSPALDPELAPAKTFPYTLDTFQSAAIGCLEKKESVLVAAHTSAGKTTVAEYAIAICLRDKQRIIYTSPIKALSNQKYRDMSEEFTDVGLMTGDVTINPDATIVIMTTEILRSMLYRGSELVRECAWVVFDEVHYMRDKERGVVWEETIILLPDTVRLVFLSATIPNSREFAEWICRIKHQPCHVVYTDYRPTPLEHFIYPAGGNGVYLVLDKKGQFHEDNFHKATSSLQSNVTDQAMEGGKKGGKKNYRAHAEDLEKMLKLCVENNYAPIIVFSFSRKTCESNAQALKRLDFTTDEEKKLIGEVFNNAIGTLGDDDKELPQVTSLLNYLSRGIGYHHGGLLPVLKEVVEILFGENLVKMLFATETFAMGINMPAKTVIFTNVRKWDGTEFRVIGPGEYIQMSGRAGRRGKDKRGVTIIMLDEKLEPEVCKDLFMGSATKIDSAFYLGYNMLLNLLRMEGADPDYMMQRSFLQFQRDRTMVALKEELEAAENLYRERGNLNAIANNDDGEPCEYNCVEKTAEYYFATQELKKEQLALKQLARKPQYVVPFLNAGRLVKICLEGVDWGWGALIHTTKAKSDSTDADADGKEWKLHVFLPMEPGSFPTNPIPPAEASKKEGNVMCVPLSALDAVSKVRANLPKDLKSAESRRLFLVQLNAIFEHDNFVDGLPELKLIKEMKLPKEEVTALREVIRNLKQDIRENLINEHPRKEEFLATFTEKMELKQKVDDLKTKVKDTTSVVMGGNLRSMRRVLRKLDFTDKNGIVQVKGRMACDLSTSDELLVAEIVFQNVFEDLSGDQIVALLSTLVFDERSAVEVTLDAKLQPPFERMQEIARRVGTVMKDCKLPIDVDEYVGKLKPQIVDIVLTWLGGDKFVDIMAACDLYEGSIVRVIRRLNELVCELATAAKNIGNTELERKLNDSGKRLKRGIIFAASLYI